jgi:hypothetical protein
MYKLPCFRCPAWLQRRAMFVRVFILAQDKNRMLTASKHLLSGSELLFGFVNSVLIIWHHRKLYSRILKIIYVIFWWCISYHVYITDKESKSVLQISPDGKDASVVLNESDSIGEPLAIRFSRDYCRHHVLFQCLNIQRFFCHPMWCNAHFLNLWK